MSVDYLNQKGVEHAIETYKNVRKFNNKTKADKIGGIDSGKPRLDID